MDLAHPILRGIHELGWWIKVAISPERVSRRGAKVLTCQGQRDKCGGPESERPIHFPGAIGRGGNGSLRGGGDQGGTVPDDQRGESLRVAPLVFQRFEEDSLEPDHGSRHGFRLIGTRNGINEAERVSRRCDGPGLDQGRKRAVGRLLKPPHHPAFDPDAFVLVGFGMFPDLSERDGGRFARGFAVERRAICGEVRESKALRFVGGCPMGFR